MKEVVKEQWVALRGGESEQGIGTLRRGDTFCRPGVLCGVLAAPCSKVGEHYRFGEREASAYPPRGATGAAHYRGRTAPQTPLPQTTPNNHKSG